MSRISDTNNNVPMREVYCVGYTPRAWGPRSLLTMLNGPFYFGLLGSCFFAGKRTFKLTNNNNTNLRLLEACL